MTKQEAIQAMRSGKKVIHKWFSPDEWMTMEGFTMVFEDGCRCDEHEFWRWRTDESWQNGYSIYNK